MDNKKYKFNISLSVLNHLGRNLYRSFVTILGEGISNSWDADANSVYIFYSSKEKTLCILDDGLGMTSEDFQDKFLRVGYTKRKKGGLSSPSGRSFIGRKGIGKLALLSAADVVTIVSKIKGGELVGGVIDNKRLDAAIDEDTQEADYPLETINASKFLQEKNIKFDDSGTLIWFDGLKEKTNHTTEFIKKSLALYFRFSLQDPGFKIYFNDELITVKELQVLCDKTQFLWRLNKTFTDDFIDQMSPERASVVLNDQHITGFVASVQKPTDRNIFGSRERVGIDVFVNGRLREVDILKHFPRSRIPEQYLYGQIHLENFDNDDIDRFTSSREGIHADDPDFKVVSEKLSGVIEKIIKEWDIWRLELREEGDTDNEETLKKEQRYSRNLYNQIASKYIPPSDQADKVLKWEKELEKDAELNLRSYAECFIAENLVRKFWQEKNISLDNDSSLEVTRWRNRESKDKNQANISIDIRLDNDDKYYIGMENLSRQAEQPGAAGSGNASLSHDSKTFAPLRNAVMHTSLLTEQAKNRLSTVLDNIRERVRTLLK